MATRIFVEHTMVNVARLVILLSMLAGCGLKGPLVLPDAATPSKDEQKNE
jgi:predicted small lipoprotein YifL